MSNVNSIMKAFGDDCNMAKFLESSANLAKAMEDALAFSKIMENILGTPMAQRAPDAALRPIVTTQYILDHEKEQEEQAKEEKQ